MFILFFFIVVKIVVYELHFSICHVLRAHLLLFTFVESKPKYPFVFFFKFLFDALTFSKPNVKECCIFFSVAIFFNCDIFLLSMDSFDLNISCNSLKIYFLLLGTKKDIVFCVSSSGRLLSFIICANPDFLYKLIFFSASYIYDSFLYQHCFSFFFLNPFFRLLLSLYFYSLISPVYHPVHLSCMLFPQPLYTFFFSPSPYDQYSQ